MSDRIAMIGLGRMGGNMVRRLLRGGHECVAFDRNPEAVRELEREGAIPAFRLEEALDAAKGSSGRRIIWMMLPAGAPTEEACLAIGAMLDSGDVLIDGGNSYFKDDIRRAQMLRDRGIEYVDAGTSGGVWGLDRGYCLMVGASKTAFEILRPFLKTLAPSEDGYLHCGPVGSGHFVKMIHNGIEYGMMQAYAEGFDILKNANSPSVHPDHRFDLDLAAISKVWTQGSVITSWLLDLIVLSLDKDPVLASFTGYVEDSGEGRWTIQAAIEEAVPAEVLSASLYARFRSRQDHTFAEKLLSAMRQGFGGHREPRSQNSTGRKSA